MSELYRECEEKEVYRIWNKESQKHEGVRGPGCHEKYDFDCAYNARHANCHDIYKDEEKYEIQKYKLTYTLIEEWEEEE